MSDNLILGKDVQVIAYHGGQWKVVACGLSCQFVTTVEYIETSTVGTGKFATFIQTKNKVTGSANGLISLGLTNTLSLPELRQLQLAHTNVLLRFDRTSVDGLSSYVDEQWIIITNISDDGPHDSVATFSLDFIGTGPLTQSFVPTTITPPGIMHNQYYTSVGTGETSWTYAPSAGKTPIGAWMQTDLEVITSGTPNATQIKYTSGTGTWEWLIPMEPDQTLHIQYQD